MKIVIPKFFNKNTKPNRTHPNQESQYESCVVCGALTNVLKEQPMPNRKYYIAGVGQLCKDCHFKLIKEIND